MTSDHGEVTRLLRLAEEGDRAAFDRLLGLVYDELRQVARRQLARERDDHTLRATDLVHEVYLKLAGRPSPDARDRAHFLALAARAMRQVLVDHARQRAADKRGGGLHRTTLDDADALALPADELLALDDALAALGERQRQVVEWRFFGGLTEPEIASLLGVTERTVRRDWVTARARLYQVLYPGES